MADAITEQTSDHHHVYAAYDTMGRSIANGWYPQLTRGEAEALAADIIAAHSDKDELDRIAKKWLSEGEYEEYKALSDVDMTPDDGWDSIWILPCSDQCLFRETCRTRQEWGEPYWVRQADASPAA